MKIKCNSNLVQKRLAIWKIDLFILDMKNWYKIESGFKVQSQICVFDKLTDKTKVIKKFIIIYMEDKDIW